jgi:hypothetical protein
MVGLPIVKSTASAAAMIARSTVAFTCADALSSGATAAKRPQLSHQVVNCVPLATHRKHPRRTQRKSTATGEVTGKARADDSRDLDESPWPFPRRPRDTKIGRVSRRPPSPFNLRGEAGDERARPGYGASRVAHRLAVARIVERDDDGLSGLADRFFDGYIVSVRGPRRRQPRERLPGRA